MNTQKRWFSREQIRKVNQDMIEGRRVDFSSLPSSVVQIIRGTRFSREEINRAFAQARRRTGEA